MLSILVAIAFAAQEPDPVTEESSARETIVRRVFDAIHEQSLSFVNEVYDEKVVFQSPLGKVEGRDLLNVWYRNLFDNVEYVKFDIQDEYTDGDTHVIVWIMHVRAKDLKGGDEVDTSGTSIIQFNDADRVVFHRDYYDMGEFVYEHVPVLKHLVRRAKKRMMPEEE